jgi:hypothetical protein
LLQLLAHVIYVIEQSLAPSQVIEANPLDDEFPLVRTEPGAHSVNDQRDLAGSCECVYLKFDVAAVRSERGSKRVFDCLVGKHLRSGAAGLDMSPHGCI